MSEQEQFLDVIDRDEAERRFQAALRLAPVGQETLALDQALGRVLAQDVSAPVDVPSFDRSNFDGFAVQARDTYGAEEEQPRTLRIAGSPIATGTQPQLSLHAGEAVSIATGGMLPRGADAIVMVEHAELGDGQELLVRRAVTPGFGVAFAGTDISAGEVVLRQGEVFTSRETGVLAAIGIAQVTVYRQPRVAILSTGDELIAPGQPMVPGRIYDSNSRILADAVRELGCVPVELGIQRDDFPQLEARVQQALHDCDVVLLSGGTSKGHGDISYGVVRTLTDPGIVAHGVALKPGKPICLAASRGKPVVVLPGFPTSAIFTFHEFVAPVLRRLGGFAQQTRETIDARLALKVNSEIGRTEYLLVGLVDRGSQSAVGPRWAAYPMGKGSGSVTAFSRADGFVTIARHEEIIEAGTTVPVQLLARHLAPADLVVIGSHCLGLDLLLGELQRQGLRCKSLAVGSTGGLDAVRRGECDVAGMHLLHPETQQYNTPYLTSELELIRGYGRLQGVVYRPGDQRFEQRSAEAAVAAVKLDPECVMVNRNAGSGTRILMDRLLAGTQPAGYGVQARNHNAVAAAVAQGRADWGLAIESAASRQKLGFLPLTAECFDFVIPLSRREKPAVAALRQLLQSPAIRRRLRDMGFQVESRE
jgi:putative molybdopterin biosynthesis protein